MRYWPVSSLCLTANMARGLHTALETRKLSAEVYRACLVACEFTPAATIHGMVLIKDDCSLLKHAFLKRPAATDLGRLERFCICENFDGEMFLMISSSH
jgi:hypothetical protein